MSTTIIAGNATNNGASISSDTAGTLQIQTGSTPTTAITVDASQNVGIGTSPSVALDVSSTANSANGQLRIASNGSNGTRMGFISTSTNGKTYQIGSNFVTGTGEFAIYNLTDATTRMLIDSSGNLLVGTTSTSYGSLSGKITCNSSSGGSGLFYTSYSGDISTSAFNVGKFDNNSTTSQIFVKFAVNNAGLGCGQINGNGAGAAAFGSFSDRRLKENIKDLPPQLANITALRPVEFDYIEAEGGGHQTGFIAQEMQSVYPDSVGERSDGMLTVTGWDKTTARLVKAIQEQQAMIEELKTKVAALEAK